MKMSLPLVRSHLRRRRWSSRRRLQKSRPGDRGGFGHAHRRGGRRSSWRLPRKSLPSTSPRRATDWRHGRRRIKKMSSGGVRIVDNAKRGRGRCPSVRWPCLGLLGWATADGRLGNLSRLKKLRLFIPHDRPRRTASPHPNGVEIPAGPSRLGNTLTCSFGFHVCVGIGNLFLCKMPQNEKKLAANSQSVKITNLYTGIVEF